MGLIEHYYFLLTLLLIYWHAEIFTFFYDRSQILSQTKILPQTAFFAS